MSAAAIGDTLALRAAHAEDSALLLRWRNDDTTRAGSRNQAEVTPAEHERWLAAALESPDRRLLICEFDGEPIGQVRFDRLEAYRYEISVALEPASRGKGLGTRLIRGSVLWLWEHTHASAVEARVRRENDVSRRAFEAAGFAPVDSDEPGFDKLALRRPEPFAPEIPSERAARIKFIG